MTWGSKVDSTDITGLTDASEQFFSQKPQLNGDQWAHVQVEADFPASPTEHMIVSVYGSLDGTNYADRPFMQFVIDSDNDDPNQADFIVEGWYQWQVGVIMTGNESVTAKMSHRVWTPA